MDNTTPLYKAYEMEEALDIYFYHPLGFRIAKAGRALSLTPDQITYASMLLGVAGGVMMAWHSTAFYGYALVIISSVLDSADGQLARMTGGGTVHGRILDGLIGYFTHLAAYFGLAFLAISDGGICPYVVFPLAVAALVFSGVQSSMYDFYRTHFASIVKKNVIDPEAQKEELGWFLKFSYKTYWIYQHYFASSHMALKDALLAKYPDGRIPPETARLYLECNRRNIRGWNVFGDNTRFIGMLVALLINRPVWYFYFIIVPMSVGFAFMIIRQKRSDRIFLEDILRGHN